ncbi:hypothetical protein [Cohnella sp. REN36]|uniref:hypothetical protein n=1 Tax=Cohnella sp. REN36 TaxID=2887347 RepID=UPI001D13FCFE|nr:hypothetical protein [Cohnella sp. REN36]MCC3374134.1 hypothetical protein [Cohnella sp. REN36]
MKDTNLQSRKKTFVSLTLAAVVASTALIAGSAYAATDTTATTAPTASAQKSEARPGHGGQFRAEWDDPTLAALLGLTADELKTKRKEGQSLADIAKAQGVDVQKVIDLEASALTKRLDQALADGKLTQAQYDAEKSKLADRATQIVNDTFSGKDGKRGEHRGFGGETQLKAGQSLAAIAADKGVALQTVTDKVKALLTAELAQQVTDGKLTQAQADERKAKLDERKAKLDELAAKLVNETPKAHGDRKHGKRDGDDGDSANATTDAASSTTAD